MIMSERVERQIEFYKQLGISPDKLVLLIPDGVPYKGELNVIHRYARIRRYNEDGELIRRDVKVYFYLFEGKKILIRQTTCIARVEVIENVQEMIVSKEGVVSFI